MRSIRALDRVSIAIITLVTAVVAGVINISAVYAANTASWTGESSFKVTSDSGSATFESVDTFTTTAGDYELFAKDGNVPVEGEYCDGSDTTPVLVIKVGDTTGNLFSPSAGNVNGKVDGNGAVESCNYSVSIEMGLKVSGTRPAGNTPKVGGLTNDYINNELFAQCPDLKTANNETRLKNFGKNRADAVIALYTNTYENGDPVGAEGYDRCKTLVGFLKNPKWLDGDLSKHLVLEDEAEVLTETTSCAVDGIGWIVCPVMTFIGKMNDAAFTFLESMLGIRPAIIASDPIRNAWAAFRDIANVAFVIAFMVIVYSQLTSAGISNYGIKKMLPRIVAAAILVNISFYICAVAVDLSNIVGSSIFTLLKDSIDVGSEVETSQWEKSVSGILGIAATGIGIILLLVAITMAPAVLLAFVLIILILIARQAFVILLIVIAPLAFVAYLLPNTEAWFKKWQKAFITVLMVYPIVGLIFGASSLASSVLVQVGQGSEEDQQLLMLIALGVLAVPLFAVPAVLKGSLSAAGSIGTKIAGLADKSTRMSGRQFGDRSKQMAGGVRDAAQRRALAGEGMLGKKGWRSGYGLGVGGLMRGRSNRNNKYNSLGERAKSAEDTYLNSDPKQALRRRQVEKGQETAAQTVQINKDQAKREHLAENHSLHDRAHQSADRLKDEQAIHKAQSTENYLANNGALRTRAVQAGISAGNAEETNKNDATTAYMAANSGVGGQYERLNESQGELEIQKDDTKNAFESNAVGMNIADRKATAGIQSNITSKRAETRAVGQNTDLNVQAQAASDTLEAAKAEESAFVQELRTDEGASQYSPSQTPEVQAAIRELQSSDTVKRVQTQRAASAQKVSNVEYATKVGDNPSSPTQLAVDAGGIAGPAGISQAQAVARQTIVKAHVEGVNAEKTLLSQVDNSELLPQFDDPGFLDRPDEQISAIAGTIAGRQHQEAHIKLWSQMGKLQKSANDEYAVADRAGDTAGKARAQAKIDKLKNMQQQVMGDKKKIPFGAGDGDQGAADVGTYQGDIYESTRERISTHLSAEKLAKMDPDDMRLIFEMAREGKLGPDELQKVEDAYKEWEDDPLLKSSLQDKHRTLLDPIRQHATTGAAAYPPSSGRKGDFWNAKFNDIGRLSSR